MQELQSEGSVSGEAAKVTHASTAYVAAFGGEAKCQEAGKGYQQRNCIAPHRRCASCMSLSKQYESYYTNAFASTSFTSKLVVVHSMISVNSFLPVLYLYIHITKVYGVLRGSGAQAVISAPTLITSDGLVTRLKTIRTLGRMLLCLLPPVNNSTIPVTNQWFIVPIHNELTICSFPVMQCFNAPYCSYLMHHVLIH